MFGWGRKKPAFVQEKKRTHKKTLTVGVYHVGKVQPYSAELKEESKSKMDDLASKDKERIMLEEAKNKLESYIYLIKNKLSDDEEEIAKISTEDERESLRKLSEDAAEWLDDDGYNAELEVFQAKYAELSEPAEKVWFRLKEMTLRPEKILALQSKLIKIEELMKKWETTLPQVTEEEKSEVMAKVAEVKEWIAEKEAEQATKEAHEDPAFSSEIVPLQTKSIEKLVNKLSKKPKPKPPKKEVKKNDTDANETKQEADVDLDEKDEAKDEASEADSTVEEEEKAEAGDETESPPLKSAEEENEDEL
jgi:hypothetical protein